MRPPRPLLRKTAHKQAFTLVEMLAVLALSGLLLTALLRVTASLGTTQRAWDATQATRAGRPAWVQTWWGQLASELAVAQQVEVTPDGHLRLWGYGGTRPGSAVPSHEPAVIRYGWAASTYMPRADASATDQASRPRGVLVRECRWLLSTTNRPPDRSSVALNLDAVRFELTTVPPPDTVSRDADRLNGTRETRSLRPDTAFDQHGGLSPQPRGVASPDPEADAAVVLRVELGAPGYQETLSFPLAPGVSEDGAEAITDGGMRRMR